MTRCCTSFFSAAVFAVISRRESCFISGSSALIALDDGLHGLHIALVLGADKARDDAVYELFNVHNDALGVHAHAWGLDDGKGLPK